MANIYVRSTDGNNADNGSTWALAKLDLAGAAAIDAAGDNIYVSQNHAESTASGFTLALAGTQTSPVKIVCVNDGAAPPTAVATTATVTTTGASPIVIGSAATQYWYAYGITFSAGSGANNANITLGGVGYMEGCSLQMTASTSTNNINVCNSAPTILKDCTFKFAAAGQGLITVAGKCEIRGGSLLSGGTSPTTFMRTPAADTAVCFDGFDFSNGSSSINLAGGTSLRTDVQFRNCKLPASWSGSLHVSTPGHGSLYELFNCDSGDTMYRYRKATAYGTIQDETTLIRSGGASDGTTGISHKMVTNANAEYPMLTLDSPPLIQRVSSGLGASKTATVEILRDSATNLTDAEVWLEVMYYGTSGVPLGSFVSDAKADILASAADQTSSSETWTTTGMANPNKQKLSVTFTPQEAGYIEAIVKCAKASTTLYYDPKVTVA